MTVLRAEPYSLLFDSLIRAKITACNQVGCGDESLANTDGALVQTEPDVIYTLLDGSTTDETNLHVEW